MDWEAAGLAQIIFDSFVSVTDWPSGDSWFAFESSDAQAEQAGKKNVAKSSQSSVRGKTCLLVNCVKGTLALVANPSHNYHHAKPRFDSVYVLSYLFMCS